MIGPHRIQYQCGKKKVHGICAMCRMRKLLCKSHYFGRAVHNLSRTVSGIRSR